MYYNTCLDRLTSYLGDGKDNVLCHMSSDCRAMLSTDLESLLESFSLSDSTRKNVTIPKDHIQAIISLISQCVKASLWSSAHTAWTCFTLMVERADTDVIQDISKESTAEIAQILLLFFQLYTHLPPLHEPLQFSILIKDISIFILNLVDKALSQDIKAHLLVAEFLSPFSLAKAFKDKKSKPFQASYWIFTRCLLRFCTPQFPLSYAQLHHFSSYQQDFFGQTIIHAARCAAESLHIIYTLMLNECQERIEKHTWTFSTNKYFKRDLSQLHYAILHCPDGLLQKLLLEHLSRYIQKNPHIWDQFMEASGGQHDAWKMVMFTQLDQSLKEAIRQWNTYGNKLPFLSYTPVLIHLGCHDDPGWNHGDSLGHLELNEFSIIFESQENKTPEMFVEIPFWSCVHPLEFVELQDPSTMQTRKGYLILQLQHTAIQWVSRNWSGLDLKSFMDRHSGNDTLPELMIRITLIEPAVSLVLNHLVMLSKRNHLRLDHSQRRCTFDEQDSSINSNRVLDGKKESPILTTSSFSGTVQLPNVLNLPSSKTLTCEHQSTHHDTTFDSNNDECSGYVTKQNTATMKDYPDDPVDTTLFFREDSQKCTSLEKVHPSSTMHASHEIEQDSLEEDLTHWPSFDLVDPASFTQSTLFMNDVAWRTQHLHDLSQTSTVSTIREEASQPLEHETTLVSPFREKVGTQQTTGSKHYPKCKLTLSLNQLPHHTITEAEIESTTRSHRQSTTSWSTKKSSGSFSSKTDSKVTQSLHHQDISHKEKEKNVPMVISDKEVKIKVKKTPKQILGRNKLSLDPKRSLHKRKTRMNNKVTSKRSLLSILSSFYPRNRKSLTHKHDFFRTNSCPHSQLYKRMCPPKPHTRFREMIKYLLSFMLPQFFIHPPCQCFSNCICAPKTHHKDNVLERSRRLHTLILYEALAFMKRLFNTLTPDVFSPSSFFNDASMVDLSWFSKRSFKRKNASKACHTSDSDTVRKKKKSSHST